MQFTPLQIKEKLLRALDDQNNVVDTAGVLEVVSILEQYPITREALEQTRIGKHINELRKKTTNEQLAKRAKKLVRNWQKLVNTDPENRQLVNGERVVTPTQHRGVGVVEGRSARPSGISPTLGNRLSVANRKSPSPAILGGKPLTPQIARVPRSPAILAGKAVTPSQASRLSPGLKRSPSSGILGLPSSHERTSPASVGFRTTTTTITTPARASSLRCNIGPGLRSSPTDSGVPRSKLDTNSPKSHSPKPEGLMTPSGRAHTPSLASSALSPSNNDDSCSSWPNMPLSGGQNEHERNNSSLRVKSHLGGDTNSRSPSKNNVKESFARKSNHSNDFPMSSFSDKGSRKDQSDISKTNVANRKRTRLESPESLPSKQAKIDVCLSKQESTLNGVVGLSKNRKGDKSNSATSLTYSKSTRAPSPVFPETSHHNTSKHSKSVVPAKAPKTPKVKTTAELIAELQKRTGGSNYGNDIMNKLKSNQIEKEVDAPRSVLPPGVKPRKKRGSVNCESLALLDPPSARSLSQMKTEMVEKFLMSSVAPSATDRMSPFKDDGFNKCESPMNSSNSFGEPHNDRVGDSVSVNVDGQDARSSASEVKTEGISVKSKAKQLTVEEILQLLPPVDADGIDWDGHEYTVGEPVTGTDSDVERLHGDSWDCVNGCYGHDEDWHDWSQTLSRTTVDGDLLHILPYVNIDD